ncbi:MAG: hypothetical protein HYV67_03450 [Candidatus Taylorbacteria bacterium]|nr:hypothetical protein [Candidatus Taylorbacteria bacterium]
MFADFLFKKAVSQKLGGLTPAEQDEFVGLVEKYPDLFMKLAEEFKAEIAKGRDGTEAALQVIKAHENELREIKE